MNSPTPVKLSPQDVEALKLNLGKSLFPEPMTIEEEDMGTYAILDGASVPDLLEHLYAEEDRPEFACLYRGELEPDMAEVAPYVVRLEPGHEFTEWLLAEGWGKNWGVFVRTRAPLKKVQRHLRKFLRVKSADGRTLLLRYYDPRVGRLFLPTCDAEELEFLFGPLESWFIEDENSLHGIEMVMKEGVLQERTRNLMSGQWVREPETAGARPAGEA